MTTKIVGIKEFRDNINQYWKKARKDHVRYIVMHRSTPVLEVNPLDSDEFVLEGLAQEVKRARAQAREGKVYSHQEVCNILGL